MNQVLVNIREIRRKLGLTQQYMAERLDIGQSHYGKIENGTIELSITRLENIAEILKVPVEEFYSYHQPKEYSTEPHPPMAVNDEMVAYIQRETQQIVEIYQKALDSKNQVIEVLTEQRDFYKKAYENFNDKVTGQLEVPISNMEKKISELTAKVSELQVKYLQALQNKSNSKKTS